VIIDWIKEIKPVAYSSMKILDDAKVFAFSNPYIIIIKRANVGLPVQNVKFMGANLERFGTSPTFGNPAGVSIEYLYSNYSYTQFLANTMNEAFKIAKIRIESSTPLYFDGFNTALSYVRFRPTGDKITYGIGSFFRSLNQFTNDAVEADVEENEIYIDGDTQLAINVKINSELKIYLYPCLITSLKTLLRTGSMVRYIDTGVIPLTPNDSSYSEPVEVIVQSNRKTIKKVF
jgi:hypothetical protein